MPGAGVNGERSTSSVDTVRGFACLLLVLHHVTGFDVFSGARSWDDPVYRATIEFFGYVRMPLFSFVSGMVYALCPVETSGIRRFVRGKLLRLLLPMAFVGLLYALTSNLVSPPNARIGIQAMLYVLIHPFAHLWFLQALLLLFFVLIVLEISTALDTPTSAMLVFGIACCAFVFAGDLPAFFSINHAARLIPFFLAGVLIPRFHAARWFGGTLQLVATGVIAIAVVRSLGGNPDFSIAPLLIGLVGCVGFTILCPTIPLVSALGRYSYTIYLYHIFGTAGTLRVLAFLGIDHVGTLFVFGLAAGIVFPIAVHMVFAPIPYLSRAMLGIRTARSHLGSLHGPAWLRLA